MIVRLNSYLQSILLSYLFLRTFGLDEHPLPLEIIGTYMGHLRRGREHSYVDLLETFEECYVGELVLLVVVRVLLLQPQ